MSARHFSLEDSVAAEVASLRAAGLLREPLVVEPLDRTRARVSDRTLICFSSNDYLGLARDPALAAALGCAARDPVVGAGASRLITGTTPAHRTAERALAVFVGQPAALLFASGYAANVGALQALAGREDIVFSDALNHASIVDGCRLSHATIAIYAHADPDSLREQLAEKRARFRRAFVVTEALFSMDGDRAPLRAIRALADAYNASLIVDEAHALGVLGPHGSGACAEAGVSADVIVGTLGKAFGVCGAFVAGSPSVVSLVENKARSFVYSTAIPPALATAISAALVLVRTADDRRVRVLAHAATIRAAIAALGYRIAPGHAQIIPVLLGPSETAVAFSGSLLDDGILAHAIRPPTVPRGTSRIRLAPSSAHSDEDVKLLIASFGRRASKAH